MSQICLARHLEISKGCLNIQFMVKSAFHTDKHRFSGLSAYRYDQLTIALSWEPSEVRVYAGAGIDGIPWKNRQ